MKKLNLIWIIELIFIASARADLIIEPSSIDIVVFQNQETKQEITLTNTNNFTIFNITFTPNSFITYFVTDRLEINQSVKKNISVTANSIFPKTLFTSTLKFNFLADIELPPVTYNVTLTRDSNNLPIVSPSQIFIITRDSVTWLNNDSLPLTVFHSSFTTGLINPNQTATRQFGTEGTFDYSILELSPLGGRVNVSKRPQQFVNNPSLNKNFIIGIESKPIESSITAEIIPKQFTVRHNKETEGIFNLKAGNQTAINIRLSADSSWVSFEESGFNMTAQQNRIIKFKIRPILVNVTESNKTYSFTLKMEGDNTNSFSDTISVDIPFEDTLSLVNESTIEDCLIENSACWIKRKEFCDAHPFSPACNPAPRKEVIEVIKYRDVNVPHNFTNQEIASMIASIAEIKDDRRKTDQFINQKADETSKFMEFINKILDEQKKISNQSLVLSEENRVRQDNLTLSVLSMTFLVIVLASITGIFLLARKLKQRKEPIKFYYPSK